MKKWKIVISSLLVATALGAGIAAVGCNKHTHTYSEDWSTSSTHHWKEPTCGDTEELGSYGEHRWNGNWVCEDCSYARSFAGLKVTKTKTEYTLEDKLTTNVSVKDIQVAAVNENGDETAITDYQLTYYKGKEKIDSMSKVSGGAYNIWVNAEVGGETKEAFVMVYVIDNVVKFDRADGFDDSARTQDLGLDVISDKWNFVVTYSSGATKTVNVRDEHIVRTNFTTFLERENETATVTYTELNVIGEPQVMTETVAYTINKNPNSNITYKEYSFDAITETLSADEQDASTTTLKQSNLIGNNAFLHLVEGGTLSYRGTKSSNNGGLKCIEVKNEALQVTFDGVGVLVIGARSNSNSAYSSIALKGEDGDYVMATYQLSNKNIGKDDDDYIYSVTGDSFNELTFEITKPGTYTIMTIEEVLSEGNTVDTNRNTRINKIELTDILTKEGN